MQENLPSPMRLVLLAVVFEGGLGVVAVGVGWLLGYPPLGEIRWTRAGLAWGAATAVPLVALLLLCVHVPFGPFRRLLQAVDELLVPLFRNCTLLELAVISLLAGVGEEILFRGVLQEAVAGWVGGPGGVWAGLVVASVIFGMAHLITPAYGVLAAAMGLYLGWLWIDTQNLLVPITAHAVYDFLALVYLAKMRAGRVPPAAAGGLDGQ
jgi:hypothetical protein